jgi:hypothetical protein
MFSEKNYIVVNEKLNNMQVKKSIAEIIANSDLSEFAKRQEYEFLNNAVNDSDVFDVDYLRKNYNRTAFIKVYAYLLGSTDVKTNELQTNLRLFGKNINVQSGLNQVGNIAGALSGLPVVGGIAGAVSQITGTSTTCGLLGSLFNTKKCREKKEQAGQLQQANTAVQNLQNTTIAQPQYVPAVMPSSYTPAVMPSSSTDAIEVQKSKGKEKEKDEKSFFEKYGILIVIGAVLLVAFLFFRKKKI